MSEPKPTIAARVSLEIKQQVARLAENTYIIASKIVEAAMEKFLGIQTGEGPSSQINEHTGGSIN
ncbi:MAG: hypothetical protein KME13_10680 [Myxacorys californica WJT36-NPBG1]|jgi:predicted DNA-binding protein|nr:hypothetical protein [Myxacorys californica WJT36-NPBG1]